MPLKRAWSLFKDPVTEEKRRLLAERFAGLPAAARTDGQGFGRKATGCGATLGIQPRCDFACTGCYLGHDANRTPALPTEAIFAQLDELRAFLGPKANVQITDGEVTLRPLPELVAILRHARAIGAIPMVMTHGDTLRRRPGMLERLMVEGGLSEISIHVDSTQRGRHGYGAARSEAELLPLRDEMADLVRTARATTGKPLRAATTLTVTRDNLPEIAGVVRWLVANRDAFGLVSFQPLAQVGRTRRKLSGVTSEELWREIGHATADFGLELPAERERDPILFGHPACTRITPLVALERAGERPRLLQLIRDQPEDRALLARYLQSGLAGAAFRDDSPLEALARGAGMAWRRPVFFLGKAVRWANRRLREEIGMPLHQLFLEMLRGEIRVGGLTLTSHHFMSAEEAATVLGQERLAACLFRLPHRGEMVPMCHMNTGGVREQIYGEIVAAQGHL